MKYYLSICAVCKNEVFYLEEWIKFHMLIGVEHFFIYDNGSDDGSFELLKALKREGMPLTVRSMADKPVQFKAYEHCLLAHRMDSEWIAFIDIDEFIVPHYDKISDMAELLRSVRPSPCLVIHWYLFGSNGNTKQTKDEVVRRFTKREEKVNRHVKCIVNPREVFRCFTPHRFTHRLPAVDEKLIKVPDNDPIPYDGTCDIIQINHYAVKSKEECYKRKAMPRADTNTVRDAEEYFKVHDKNEVDDFHALDIWIRGRKE